MGLLDTFLSGDSGQDTQGPLDQLFSVTPQMRQQAANQGMVQMAAGLLQAGGPSRMPVNFGQALGYGMQQGVGGYNSSLQNNMRNQAMAGQLAQNKLAVLQGLAGQAAMARAFGQPVPSYLTQYLGGGNVDNAPAASVNQATPTDTAAPAPASQPGSAPNWSPSDFGVQQSAGGNIWGAQRSPLTNAGFAPVAGLLDTPTSSDATPAASGAPSAPVAGQPLLRLPPGMNGATAYALSMNPATAPIIQKAIGNQYPGPSDVRQLQLEAASLPDGPEKDQLEAKITKINSITARAGGYVMVNGKWTWLPKVQDGAMPAFDAQGNPTGAVVAQPGAAGVARTMSTATSFGSGVGKAYTTPQIGTLGNGAQGVTGSVGQALHLPAPAGVSGGAVAPAGSPAAGNAPSGAQPKQYPWAVGNGPQYNVLPGQTGLAPGQEAQANAQVKNSEQLRQANTQAAEVAKQSNYKLDRLEAAMQHFTPGPAAQWKGNLATLLSKYGLANGDVNQYLGGLTEYNKYSTQLAADMSNMNKAGNAVTVFETMQKANPNVQTPVDAAHNILASNRALNDYTIARSAMQNAWAESHQGNVNGFNDWYTNHVNPNAFLLPRMSQTERQTYFHTLSKPQLQQLMQDYRNVQTWKQQGLF